MKRLLALLLALLVAGPAFGQTVVQTDNVRAELLADVAGVRPGGAVWGGGEAGGAVLGRAAPDHPAEVAHLLEEPGRIGPADRDQVDPAGGCEGRPHRLARAASLRYPPPQQTRRARPVSAL